MKKLFSVLLSFALLLSLCACSLPNSSLGTGSKDRTDPESREDWNSSSGTQDEDLDVPQDDSLSIPSPEDEEEEPSEQEPSGEDEPSQEDLLDLPPVDGEADDDAPITPSLSDLSGTWHFDGDVDCSLTFSGTEDASFTYGEENDPQTFEGTFQLDGAALSLSLTGSGGELISPLFTVSVEGDKMTLSALTGSTLPGLSKQGETLVFTLSENE